MSKAHDPRAEIQHELSIGHVYEDSRSDEELLVVYLDDDVALLRDRDGNHRLEPRKPFEMNVGSGRYSFEPEAEPFGETGRLDRVLDRAEEYDEREGRKASHYAEALREAVAILSDEVSPDDREPVDLEEVDGIGSKTASRLRSNGYRTRGDVREASDDELLAIGGMGDKNLDNLREHVG